MITPELSLSQTPDTLIVTIVVPYCNVEEIEVEVVDQCLIFSCFPYYIQLNLPGSVREECESVSYCFISDSVQITLQKKWQGEEFKQLDLYPTLLINNKKLNKENGFLLEEDDLNPKLLINNKKANKENGFSLEDDDLNPKLLINNKKKNIQNGFSLKEDDLKSELLINNKKENKENGFSLEDDDLNPKLLINNKKENIQNGFLLKEDDFKSELLINNKKENKENGFLLEEDEKEKVDQVEEREEEEKGDSYSFGFALKGNIRFATVAHEFLNLFDIDPTTVTVKERRNLKLELEQSKFNSTQYLVDIDDEEITYVIEQNAPWNCLLFENINGDFKEDDFFKNHIKTFLRDECLTPLEETYCLNGLIDILYAYCYDRRTTYFEGTCESSWTISKLSATLSCFCVFDNAREVIVSAYRRTLIYPLYRNFHLAKKTFQDLKTILKLGRDYVVRCILNIYHLFAKSDYYILNNLFIKDYIYYVRFSKEDVCKKALNQLQHIKLHKNDLGLRLHVYEELNDITIDSFHNYPILSDDSDDNTEET